MLSETRESAIAASEDAKAPSPRARYRIRFQKTGELRLVSHHDLMHCFERQFRRAGLSVPTTQGFNPRMRLWFAQSLALGLAGLNEVLELELTDPLAPDELQQRLSRECPPGLTILSVRRIDSRMSAQVRRAFFRLPLPAPIPDLPARCDAFLKEEHHWVERTRPQRRRLDLRPFVFALSPSETSLEMSFWVTPYGAVRPEEIVNALGLSDLLAGGAVLERFDLELADEATDKTPLPAGLPMQPTRADSMPEESPDRTEPPAPASRPTAIVTGPLSFDS